MLSFLKETAFWAATILVAPSLLSYWIRSGFMGRDRALQGSTQLLSLVPGVLGQYVRRAFLVRVLEDCDPSATIEFGTIFSKVGARLGKNVYVGPRCHLGLVDLGADVLLAPGVHVPSGARTHGTADPELPYREQPGEVIRIHVGNGAWIGSNAVLLADVGERSIVAAGSVVTTMVPPGTTARGVPARSFSAP